MTLAGVAARTPDGRTLFDNLNLTVGRERLGVVGRNGAGKSTLLRLIAGLQAPSEGDVARPARIGWLEQAGEPGPDETVAAGLGVDGALARLARITSGRAEGDDLELADWALEARLDAALADVGLPALDLDRPTASLSGGERTRLRLAALLLDAPDLLVLDEPTNHLDADGRRAVAELLERWRGGAVVASHDRALLRRMDRIVELSGLGVATYGGGYDLYVGRKAAERSAAEAALDNAQRNAAQVKRDAQSAIDKKARRDRAGRAFAMKGSEPRILLSAQAERAELSSARSAHLAERKSHEAEAALTAATEQVERTRKVSIPMTSTGLAPGRTVLVLEEAAWTAPDGSEVLTPLSLRLTGSERVAVTGANGAGKSTLLKLIAGDLAPTTGRIDRPVGAVLLDQDAALLRPEETLVEAWRRLNPSGTPNQARAALARFLFRNVEADRRVSELSGGERLRAALACVMTGDRPPRMLLLDEPTNHLDLESVTEIEAALRAYDGALLVVSHDADFLEAIGVERRIDLVNPSR